MTVAIHQGDSREVIATLAADSIDSVVTDPPYALVSIVKRFGADGAASPISDGATGVYKRSAAGFMGKKWDTGETAFDPDFWRGIYRVLKPGGHVLAFGGTRTYHRLACAIEDAGFEIRDQIAWLYGSGFPKSHNAGNGWGTALKPALEPIVLARKPLIGTVAENILKHGTGAINVDGCRVATNGDAQNARAAKGHGMGYHGADGVIGAWDGANGRWPANVLHDGSDEVVGAGFPSEAGAFAPVRGTEPRNSITNVYNARNRCASFHHGDSGSAARFFYAAKADETDRIGSKHPTVKPVDLMQYLCRLITPPGGVVLDPFAGSGSTGEAALREGFRAILIEREEEYIADIRRRMALALTGPDERQKAIIKAKGKLKSVEGLPLFGGAAE